MHVPVGGSVFAAAGQLLAGAVDHGGKAVELTLKAVTGKPQYQGLHTANAERAAAAGVRDVQAAVELLIDAASNQVAKGVEALE